LTPVTECGREGMTGTIKPYLRAKYEKFFADRTESSVASPSGTTQVPGWWPCPKK
jgi:hypothetical protein